MSGYPADHAGLQILPLDDCLRLLASVPVGRIGFHADGEVVVLPVNHAVDGQDVVFKSANGLKLSAAESARSVVFEADHYDELSRTGWSVVLNGRAEMVYDDAEIRALDRLRLAPWATGVERPFWIRIRPTSITGRMIPAGEYSGHDLSAAQAQRTAAGNGSRDWAALQVFNVLAGEASQVRASPFGEVGTVFSGQHMELVWVSKQGELIDEHWFQMKQVDLIMVIQGQLKLEFEAPDQHDRVLGVGEVLVLPADARCRAYRWPRDADKATIFMAAYPTGGR